MQAKHAGRKQNVLPDTMQVTTGQEGFFGDGNPLVVYNPRDYSSNPNQYGSEWAQFVSVYFAALGSPQPSDIAHCVCWLLSACSLGTEPEPQAALRSLEAWLH